MRIPIHGRARQKGSEPMIMEVTRRSRRLIAGVLSTVQVGCHRRSWPHQEYFLEPRNSLSELETGGFEVYSPPARIEKPIHRRPRSIPGRVHLLIGQLQHGILDFLEGPVDSHPFSRRSDQYVRVGRGLVGTADIVAGDRRVVASKGAPLLGD